jgi:hypothetical protein
MSRCSEEDESHLTRAVQSVPQQKANYFHTLLRDVGKCHESLEAALQGIVPTDAREEQWKVVEERLARYVPCP